MGVSIDNDPKARACVVRLSGDVDLAVVPGLREDLEIAIEGGCSNVILDLEDVVFIDSTALGLIVWLDRQLTPTHGKLVLAGASPDIGRIIELSGLVGLTPTIASRDDVEGAIADLVPISTSSVPNWTESMSLPAQVESLAQVRATVCDLLSSVDLSESALFDVRVAVGEALANAVRHGSPGGETDQIAIDVFAYDDRVVIRVSDRGSGFDGDEGFDADLFASGGRGVLFMRALMDEVSFDRDADTGGTVVTMEKHLRARVGDGQ